MSKQKKVKMPQPVEIVWVDACFNANIHSTEEAVKMPLIEVRVVGFLVARHEDRVVVAHEWDARDEQWRYMHSIPVVNIIKLRKLR